MPVIPTGRSGGVILTHRYKIAVYAICKNEAAHAERFMASMGEADAVYILDTGSDDGSPARLRSLGAEVQTADITPWRFDTARSMALGLVPMDTDICVCCDLDEVFDPGWRDALEAAWTPGCTRAACRFYYDDRGSFFYRDLIHARRGFVWAWPVHEALVSLAPEVRVTCEDIRLRHLPDPQKSRAAYLPLLEQAVRDMPGDVRMLRYLGREYVYRGQYDRAIPVLERHAALEPWDAQRAASLRDLARCRWYLAEDAAAQKLYLQSIEACPRLREGYVELAQFCLHRAQYGDALLYALGALAIQTPDRQYFNEGFAWGPLPWQIAAAAAQALDLPMAAYYKQKAAEA